MCGCEVLKCVGVESWDVWVWIVAMCGCGSLECVGVECCDVLVWSIGSGMNIWCDVCVGPENIGLILEFSRWILDKHPEAGLKVMCFMVMPQNLELNLN